MISSSYPHLQLYFLWLFFLLLETLSIKYLLKNKVNQQHHILQLITHNHISKTQLLIASLKMNPYSIFSQFQKLYFISVGSLLLITLWSIVGIIPSILITILIEFVLICIWEVTENSQHITNIKSLQENNAQGQKQVENQNVTIKKELLYALINSIMIIALYSLISRSIAPVNLLIYPILVYFSIVLFVGRLFTSMIVAKIVHLRHLKSEKLASKEQESVDHSVKMNMTVDGSTMQYLNQKNQQKIQVSPIKEESSDEQEQTVQNQKEFPSGEKEQSRRSPKIKEIGSSEKKKTILEKVVEAISPKKEKRKSNSKGSIKLKEVQVQAFRVEQEENKENMVQNK